MTRLRIFLLGCPVCGMPSFFQALGHGKRTPHELLWVAAMTHTGDCLEVMRTFTECLSVGGAE
jgi:hypothetical protein